MIKYNNGPELHHPASEIHNKWLFTINSRLKFDKILTNVSRYGKKALSEELVLKTWSGVLRDEDNIPDNWIRLSGV